MFYKETYLLKIQEIDLHYLMRILEEHELDLRRMRYVYYKPWPEAEEACDRLGQAIRNAEREEKV